MEPTILLATPLRLDLSDERGWMNDGPLDLSQKPFALLKALMLSPERMMTKEELIEIVWEGRAVSDAVLTTAMRELRKALADDARAPTFIQTVHGRGYRFIKQVERVGVSRDDPSKIRSRNIGPSATRKSPHWLVGLAIVAAAISLFFLGRVFAPSGTTEITLADNIGPNAVAVLPFEDLSETGDQAYFSEGLSVEILNTLVRVEGLQVASRTSSFAYKDQDGTRLKDIAGELGVRHVLDGSVRRVGDKVRVTAQLIDAQSDRSIWSESYDRELTVANLLAIQDEVAGAIVEEIRGQVGTSLSRSSIETTSAAAGTTSLDAYDAYLRANDLFADRRDLEQALEFVHASLSADPQFARGWELLGAISFVLNGGQPTQEAQDAVETALSLDPKLSLAHALKGVMNNIHPPYDWELTIGLLEQAVELDPKNTTALQWLGLEFRKLGYLEQAMQIFGQCLAIDPTYHRCRSHRIYAAHMIGQSDLAKQDYRTLVAQDAAPDDDILLIAFLADDNLEWADRVVASLSDNPPFPPAIYEAIKRWPAAPDESLKNELRRWVRSESGNPRDFYSTILSFGAYDLIEIQQGSYFGLWLPEFPEYRSSPDFERFIRAMGIDSYWRANGFPPQCRSVGEEGFECVH